MVCSPGFAVGTIGPASRLLSCCPCGTPAPVTTWLQILQKICWYAALSPTYNTAEGSSSDVATLVSTTLADKKLSELPLYRQLLTTFTNTEIVRWGLFEAQFGAEMVAQLEVFGGELGPTHLEDLKLRVVEHNVLVLSKYYTRITTKRLAQLLDLTPEKVGLGQARGWRVCSRGWAPCCVVCWCRGGWGACRSAFAMLA
jgi:hypothetical protein